MKNIKSGLIIGLIVTVFILSVRYLQVKEDYEALKNSLIDVSVDNGMLYIEGEAYGLNQFISNENGLFITLDAIENGIDSSVVVSGSGQRIYINSENISFNHQNETIKTYVEAHLDAVNFPLYFENEIAYFSLDALCKIYDLDYKWFENTNVLTIYAENSKVKMAKIKNKAQMFKQVDEVMIPYEKKLQNEAVYLLNKTESYAHILTSEGESYYVKSDRITSESEIVIEPLVYEAKVKEVFMQPISLSWETIENYKHNFNKMTNIFPKGLNVISPTWFNLNIDGIIINSGEIKYSDNAHEQGLEVWGLYKNNFDPDWTHELLISEKARAKSIAQLLVFTSFYDLDGINIDFENIYLEDQEDLTSYISEMNALLSLNGITLSMDVTRPEGSDQWSKVYDRKALSKSVDYMILMAYDEHWGSSPTSGPVASMPWTEASISMSLEEIPREKLILGIPLYMRVWQEKENESGNYKKVGSQAITQTAFDNLIQEKALDIIFDEENGQYYTEYMEGEIKYRIWIEDAYSIRKRLELLDHYKLQGLATWRRGYENESTYDIICNWLE